jgi:DNA-binding LacI/PurR family transcriptional regulator
MLTTVNLPKGDMGRFTVDLLLDRIKGGHGNVVRLEIEGNLMARNSCSPVDEANVTEYYI